jgi:cellulose synthase/poly-beta-1,6-N-acetylglucosamine synthase-like glycosyltransferase
MAKLMFVSSTTALFAALTLLRPLFILPDLSYILTNGLQRPKGKKVSAFGLITTIFTEDMFITIRLW